MGDFVGDQSGAAGRSRVGGEKLPDWWARLSRLNPALSPDLVASILAAGDGPPPNPVVATPVLQFLVGFSNGAFDDPADITTVASPAGTLGAANEWTDITPWVMRYSMRRGRQHELSQFEAGTIELDLNDEDGRFNPQRTSGPYYGLLKIRKPVQVRATWDGVTYNRFTGHVNAWPTVWPDTVTAFAQLHATDAQRVLQGAKITTTGYPVQVVADGASSYWRFGDPIGSTQARDQIGSDALAPVSDAAIPTFGDTGAMDADSGTCATFSTSTAGFAQLIQTTQSSLSSSTGVTTEFWFNQAAPSATTTFTVAMFTDLPGFGWFEKEVIIQGGTSPEIQVFLNAYVTASVDVCDGTWHHIAATATLTSPSTVYIYVDGVQVGTGTAAWSSSADGGNAVQLQTAGAASASIQELAVYPTVLTGTQIALHYNKAAFPQESTGARVGRVLDTIGWPSTARNVDTGVSTVQAVTSPLTTTPALQHMQDCQATEGGALYIDVSGHVRFVSRAALVSESVYASSQVTFGEFLGDVPFSPPPTLGIDDIDIYNEATGQRTGGKVQTVIDQTSIDEYGRATWSPAGQLLGISDDEVQGMMSYVVTNKSEPSQRLQSFDVNMWTLAVSDQCASVLGLELLTRVTVRRGGGATNFEGVGQVEAIAENATPGGPWTVTLSLDPSPQDYWILGQSALGVDTRLHY